jgi:hypothetical protein
MEVRQNDLSPTQTGFSEKIQGFLSRLKPQKSEQRVKKDNTPKYTVEQEINALENIKQTYVKYGEELKKLDELQDPDQVYKFVEKLGYTVQKLPLGSKYVDEHGNDLEITLDNSVRIGKGKILYVGIFFQGIDFSQLIHDVNVIALGGKNVPGCAPLISPTTFDYVTRKSNETTYSIEQLKDMSAYDEKTGWIHSSYLFDALISGKLQYRDIRYPR